MGGKYGGGKEMKCVICIMLTENRSGPMNFGTFDAECRKNIDINPDHEYIIVDMGISGDEMECKQKVYSEYANVRFVAVSNGFYEDAKMTSVIERVESSIYLIWNEYIKNPKLQYKNSDHKHMVWTNDFGNDTINRVINSITFTQNKILHRSNCLGFSPYGGFKVSDYEGIMMEELFNTNSEKLAFV